MAFPSRSLVFASVVALCSLPKTNADDWPQFLGPQRNGISSETGLLDEFPDGGPNVLWRVPGGGGMSAVAVADGLAVTSWNKRGKQWLAALDAETGETVWETPLGETYENSMGNGPRATPTISDGVVYMFTGDGILCALEQKSGDLIWQVNTVDEFNAEPSDYGMSSSPLVVDGLVVVHIGADDATVGAFDAKTGKPVWQAGNGPAGYSSPTLIQIGKTKQVVSVNGDQAIGISPKSGETLWTFPFETDFACNTANPVGVDGDVFISAGENHGCVLLDIQEDGGQYKPVERWASLGTQSKMRNEWQTSIVHDGYLYGFDNVGAAGPVTHLSCLDIKTGELVWQQKRFGKGNMVLADGKLWITTMDGELVLLKATPEKYQELGRATLFGQTRQTMSIANGRGYIRDDKEVVCIKLK